MTKDKKRIGHKGTKPELEKLLCRQTSTISRAIVEITLCLRVFVPSCLRVRPYPKKTWFARAHVFKWFDPICHSQQPKLKGFKEQIELCEVGETGITAFKPPACG